MLRPDAVHHHAGRQRIVGTRQPLGECQPAAGGTCARPRRSRAERGLAICQDRGHSRSDQRSGIGRFSAAQNVRRCRIAAVPQRADFRFGLLLHFQQFDLALGLLGALAIPGVGALQFLRLDLQQFFEFLRQVFLHFAPLARRGVECLAQIIAQALRQLRQTLVENLLL